MCSHDKTCFNYLVVCNSKILKLSDFIVTISIKGEYGINAAAVEYNPDLPAYLRITDLGDNNQLDLSKRKSVNDDESDKFILGDNEIVFARTGGTVGKTYLHNEVKNGIYVFAGFLIRFKTDPKLLNPKYLKLYTETLEYWNWVKVMSVRSGQPGINGKEYSSLKIPLPPLPEQKKIADILSTWDKAIETTQALIKKLQLRKKGLMQQLLTGKKRLPGFSGEWEVVQFKDIIKERSEYPDGDLPLYSLTIQDGVTPKTERYERSFLLTTTVKAYKKMCTNDFALNPMNLRFGAIAKHSGDLDVCVSKYYNIFYCLDDFNSTYFEYYLQSNPMIQYYNKMAIGSLEEKKRVHFSDFIKFKKQLPSYNEQTAIAQVITKADEEINQTQNYLNHLQEQKKGLMQQLLTGQKRVKV